MGRRECDRPLFDLFQFRHTLPVGDLEEAPVPRLNINGRVRDVELVPSEDGELVTRVGGPVEAVQA